MRPTMPRLKGAANFESIALDDVNKFAEAYEPCSSDA